MYRVIISLLCQLAQWLVVVPKLSESGTINYVIIVTGYYSDQSVKTRWHHYTIAGNDCNQFIAIG